MEGHGLSFGWNFWRSGKEAFNEKAKIINRGSLCCARESTGSELQDDVTPLSNTGSLSMSNESTCFWLQYDPSLISVA